MNKKNIRIRYFKKGSFFKKILTFNFFYYKSKTKSIFSFIICMEIIYQTKYNLIVSNILSFWSIAFVGYICISTFLLDNPRYISALIIGFFFLVPLRISSLFAKKKIKRLFSSSGFAFLVIFLSGNSAFWKTLYEFWWIIFGIYIIIQSLYYLITYIVKINFLKNSENNILSRKDALFKIYVDRINKVLLLIKFLDDNFTQLKSYLELNYFGLNSLKEQISKSPNSYYELVDNIEKQINTLFSKIQKNSELYNLKEVQNVIKYNNIRSYQITNLKNDLDYRMIQYNQNIDSLGFLAKIIFLPLKLISKKTILDFKISI